MTNTFCEDLGPACVQGTELLLYAERHQPTKGHYTPVEADVLRKLSRLRFTINWGGDGGNPDGWMGNLARFQGTIKAWPAGSGAVPPEPWAACETPLILATDFQGGCGRVGGWWAGRRRARPRAGLAFGISSAPSWRKAAANWPHM